MGADRFIALDADRLQDAAGQADLVVDTIGGEVLARSPALLRPGGTLVTIKAAAQSPAGRDDIRQVVFVQESNRAQLIELARLVDQGHLRPQVGAVYPLSRSSQGVHREGHRRHPRQDRPPALIHELPGRSTRPPTCRSARGDQRIRWNGRNGW